MPWKILLLIGQWTRASTREDWLPANSIGILKVCLLTSRTLRKIEPSSFGLIHMPPKPKEGRHMCVSDGETIASCQCLSESQLWCLLKYNFLGPVQDLMNQKFYGYSPGICILFTIIFM